MDMEEKERRKDTTLPLGKRFCLYFKEVFNKHDVLLLPNILCYLRFILSAVFLFLYLYPNDLVSGDPLNETNFLFNSTLCGLMLLLCGFTDFVDGFIARKFSLYSRLGKALDPTADKVLQLFIGIGFTVKVTSVHAIGDNVWDMYYLFYVMLAIFILKEGTLFFANIFLLDKGKELKGASWFGKFTTFIFYVNMGLLVIFYYYFLTTGLIILINFMVILNIVCITIAYLMYFSVFKKTAESSNE